MTDDHPGRGSQGATFPLPHPEGEFYDPAGYRQVLRQGKRLNRLYGWSLGLSFLSGILLLWPFLAFVALLVSSAIHSSTYRERLLELERTVAREKRRRELEDSSALSSTRETVNESRLMLKAQLRRSAVVNNVTLNFSDGSTFSGPLLVGQNITLSYSAAESAADTGLRDSLGKLVRSASAMIEQLTDAKRKEEASEQLKTLTEQAASVRPSKWLIETSGKGLIEAAKTVAEMCEPVTTSVRAVLALLGGEV